MGKVPKKAVPIIANILESTNSLLVQQYCCEALGTMCFDETSEIVDIAVKQLRRVLLNCTNEVSMNRKDKGPSHIRFTAALSLARIGKRAASATVDLKHALEKDKNRYVNANALLALQRIGTEESLAIANAYLNRTKMWCYKTTSQSQF
jgi:HEAT repeat protein